MCLCLALPRMPELQITKLRLVSITLWFAVWASDLAQPRKAALQHKPSTSGSSSPGKHVNRTWLRRDSPRGKVADTWVSSGLGGGLWKPDTLVCIHGCRGLWRLQAPAAPARLFAVPTPDILQANLVLQGYNVRQGPTAALQRQVLGR